jgi:hypothetical protein
LGGFLKEKKNLCRAKLSQFPHEPGLKSKNPGKEK